jgi:hypothetical protein
MDQPEETPTLPARFYRQKAAEARRVVPKGRLAISIGWPMPLTALRKHRTRSRR